MELNIKQLSLIVIKKLPIIVSVALLSTLLMFVYTSFFVTPLYSSSAMLSIQASENRGDYKSVTTADHTVSIELVSTISELIKNEDFGKLVVMKDNEVTSIPLSETAGKLKYVSPDDSIVAQAKMLGISFGD